MHRTQIEICSNLEACVCLSYDAMTKKKKKKKKKAIFRKEIFFVKIFGKPISKCVVLFRLRCLPARKRRKVSLNLGDLWWFCLLFSADERIAVGSSSRAAFYLFVVARVGAVPAILWRMQLVPSCWSASSRTNISLYTCLQSNFSIVYF